MKKASEKRASAFVVALLPLFLLILSPARAFGQGPPQQQSNEASQEERQDAANRQEAELARQLNLTEEQIAGIRAIREKNREQRRAINQRVRAARMALDKAIYVDNADEAVIETRVRELAEAEAAALRMQALTELHIRRILTAEQLETLRRLRQRARREGDRDRRMPRERDERRRREDGIRPDQRGLDGPMLPPPQRGERPRPRP